MDTIFQAFVIIAISIVVFILCRSFILWYFKISERIELINHQNKLLAENNKLLKSLISGKDGLSIEDKAKIFDLKNKQ